MKLSIEVSDDVVQYLEVLTKSDAMGGQGTIEGVLGHLVHSAAAGVRRPGAWERGWVEQAFGGVSGLYAPSPAAVLPRALGGGMREYRHDKVAQAGVEKFKKHNRALQVLADRLQAGDCVCGAPDDGHYPECQGGGR